ncbi:MAG: SNF2-related protein [Opitutales bacterium]
MASINAAKRTAFEKLSIGALYYMGDRRAVEYGLKLFQSNSVESLQWRKTDAAVIAKVTDFHQKKYRVALKVRQGELEHHCNCAAWKQWGRCKHAVAGAAAMFLAVQGKNPGGIKMDTEYALNLRAQLGFEDAVERVAESAEPPKKKTAKQKPAAELLLKRHPQNGYPVIEILDRTPIEFLRALELYSMLRNYGFGHLNWFYLHDPDKSLPHCLEEAPLQNVRLLVEMEDGRKPLAFNKEIGALQVDLDLRNDKVHPVVSLIDENGSVAEARGMITDSSLVLRSDGTLQPSRNDQVADFLNFFPSEETDRFDLFQKTLPLPVREFNEHGWRECLDREWIAAGELRFSTSGKEASIREIASGDVKINLDLQEPASGSTGEINYDLSLLLADQRIDARPALDSFSELLVREYGSLFKSKTRLLPFLDMTRRFLAADKERRGQILAEPAVFCEAFAKPAYANSLKLFFRQMAILTEADENEVSLAANPESGEWLCYSPPWQMIGMVVFGFLAQECADDLSRLERNALPPPSDGNTAGVLQRACAVCDALGVHLTFNGKTLRREPLLVELEGKPDDTEIDWFALHPSVRCGERTLTEQEWRRLIQGDLVLKDPEGRIILPDTGTDETGMDVLARLLAGKKKNKGRADNAAPGGEDPALTVSRLEMLDWIALRQRGIQLRLPDEAERLFQRLLQFERLEAFRPPKSLHAQLRPYQKEGCAWIDFLYEHRFGACLADDMGLGKTIQAIAFIAKCKAKRRIRAGAGSVLVVVPPSLVFNWLDEFRHFAPSLKVLECIRRDAASAEENNADVLLTTYDRVRLDIRTLESKRFEIVVFDEAHNLKNVAAGRTKAALRLNRRFTLCLTGTPVENNPNEFYSVMSAAVPGVFGTLPAFKQQFRKAPNRLLARARPFILRRTKAKILKELPSKEEHDFLLEMSDLQKELYTRTVEEVRKEVAEAYEDKPGQQAGIVALAALLRLRQVCVGPELLGRAEKTPAPKFAHMLAKLEELHAEGHAALVFSQFRGALDQMEAVAVKAGLPYLRMDGQTPVAKRKQRVADFQSENGPPFFFISLKTGGVGLNLTRANYVFHLDPWWNPAVENQASARAHRIGQKRAVFVQRLVMQHSIEERMLQLKARKADLFRQLVEDPGEKASGAAFSREDFEFLING